MMLPCKEKVLFKIKINFTVQSNGRATLGRKSEGIREKPSGAMLPGLGRMNLAGTSGSIADCERGEGGCSALFG